MRSSPHGAIGPRTASATYAISNAVEGRPPAYTQPVPSSLKLETTRGLIASSGQLA